MNGFKIIMVDSFIKYTNFIRKIEIVMDSEVDSSSVRAHIYPPLDIAMGK